MNRPLALVGLLALVALLYTRKASAYSPSARTGTVYLPAPIPESGGAGEVATGPGASLLDTLTQGVQTVTTGLTRGERNNNPGNLRHGVQWLGLSATQNDPDFAQFDSAEDGIRALALNLRNYQLKYGLHTVREIVNRWAPPVENDTQAYVNAVAADMGVGPDAPLDLTNGDTLTMLTYAIIHHENGRVAYDINMVEANALRALSA